MEQAQVDARRRAWFRVALLAGVGYFVVGKVFALSPDHLRAWRLAAWAVSGLVYAVHIAYEHFGLQSSRRVTALHTAVAVAIGAIALAVAGMVHALSSDSGIGPEWLLALVLWPLVTAVPAFLVALVAGTILARFPRGADAG